MPNLEHRNYGAMGSEFIFHHCALRPRRLLVCFFVTTTLSVAFKLHEMNVKLLWFISMLLAFVLVLRLFKKVKKEALLVLPSLGVQIRTQYWLGHQETQFFDRGHIKGIVITEAVTMQSVLSYLAVLLASHPSGPVETIVPLFTHSSPCLRDLVYMYQAVEGTCTDSSTAMHDQKEEETKHVGAGEDTVTDSTKFVHASQTSCETQVGAGDTIMTQSKWTKPPSRKKDLPVRSQQPSKSKKS